MNKVLLTAEEAADALSIGRTKLYELLAAGLLRSVQIGKSRRIPVSAIHEFVDRLAPKGEETTDPSQVSHVVGDVDSGEAPPWSAVEYRPIPTNA